MSAIPEKDWVPISALNHYAFCPRRCYYIHVEQLFEDNHFTELGHIHHKKVHQDLTEWIGDSEIHYQFSLFSRRFGLYGKGDKVICTEGEVFPVEYKSGKRRRWRNDQLQLCAQAMCLEEMFHQSIHRGFLFYQKSRRRLEIPIDQRLREETLQTIQSVRLLLHERRMPASRYDSKCEGCSFQPICLPREVAMVKDSYNLNDAR